MIGKAIILRDFRKVLKAGDDFEFRPGVNLIVGDQGTGKSSLFQLIKDFCIKNFRQEDTKQIIEVRPTGPCRVSAFDHEKDNPRMVRSFSDNIMLEASSMFASHGEVVRAINDALEKKKEGPPTAYLFDEPDSALCIRSIHRLIRSMKTCAANGNQIIAVVHNPLLILSQPEVFDMEQKKWVSSVEFVNKQGGFGSDLPFTPEKRYKTACKCGDNKVSTSVVQADDHEQVTVTCCGCGKTRKSYRRKRIVV